LLFSLDHEVVMTFRPFRYFTIYDYLVLSIEFCVIIYMIFWAILESKRLQLEGFAEYFTDFWHIAEWTNVIGFLSSIILRIVFIIKVGSLELEVEKGGTDDLWELAGIYQTECNIAAINSFILYIQIFKYLAHLEGVARITAVLKRSVPQP